LQFLFQTRFVLFCLLSDSEVELSLQDKICEGRHLQLDQAEHKDEHQLGQPQDQHALAFIRQRVVFLEARRV